jgi:hypothetical protein
MMIGTFYPEICMSEYTQILLVTSYTGLNTNHIIIRYSITVGAAGIETTLVQTFLSMITILRE